MRARDHQPSLAQRVASSAVALIGRFGLLTLLSAAATIAITRVLGPSRYGQYASAIATWAVLGAAADFGFTLMLSRDAAGDEPPPRSLLHRSYEAATVWCALLAAIQLGLAFAAGIGTARGGALLVLTPAMVFNGLNPARAVFLVRYRARRLLVIDAAVATFQVAAILILLALGGGPVALAGAISVASVAGNVAVAWAAERLLGDTVQSFRRRELLRRAAPLGIMSIMTQVYFTVDLVILGWLVSGPRLGDYAAASKLLTLLTGIAGMVMTSALPALSSQVGDRAAVEALAARLWHWLLVLAVPAFFVVAAAAPLVIDVTIGHRYAPASSLVRILCLAGIVSVLNNLLGSLMIALRKMRALFVQNSAAIVLNVVGNVVLVPHFGVRAAAWLTVATELLVCLAALRALGPEMSFRKPLQVSGRPACALLVAAAAGFAFADSPPLALVLVVLVFLTCTIGLRAWPSELRAATLSRRLRARRL